ncbi:MULTISPECIES: hypothetical protein [unclassified Modestobacter]|uniref:hypothetical protein n=1 Tax=unclassified Modestobacter TaxID=2643866 RepID=UPI0022AA28D3|nr:MULTISPECIES: hypothetical protein [unclassified Modestobacter]MCZ2825992.1 hypothetical protein [Modestobacter sp. VKM Ac-2981]MCZ2852943.1 hypothetical protein [Modestobacter sp. VKM Ac-2982]
MRKRSARQAAAAFWARVGELGAVPEPGSAYINTKTPVPLTCRNGHNCAPLPEGVLRGGGVCPRWACARPAQAEKVEAAFLALVDRWGAELAPGARFINVDTPVKLICQLGHPCAPRPASLKRQGPCVVCGGKDPKTAEGRFLARVHELGAKLAPGARYVNSRTPVQLICRRGHRCAPLPPSLKRQGPCPVCADRDRKTAEGRFLARVYEVKATLAPGAKYVNNRTPVQLICRRGHRCAPRPASLKRQGPCPTCVQRDSQVAKADFLKRVKRFGARLAPGACYVNNRTPVRLICAEGHDCAPRPAHLQQGQGPCQKCARNDPSAAKTEFLERVTAFGARLAPGASYVGTLTPVRLICAKGHDCAPRPAHLQQGQGPCQKCARNDPAAAETEFLARVAALGAQLAPGATYINRHTPVPLICKNEHRCAPSPGSLQQGQGPCGECVVAFDRLYLVVHSRAGAVKVGIASQPARIDNLCRRGYQLVAVWTGLTHTDAVATEKAVLALWRGLGAEPVAEAPRDGRTETAPQQYRTVARDMLITRLGAPDYDSEDGTERNLPTHELWSA